MLAATSLALGAAVIHAGWNLLIKTSGDRALAAWGQFLTAGLLSTLGLAVVGPPGWDALPFLVTSACVHVVYAEALVAAYEHGDFSLSYPLARGGGAVLAALGSVALLDDRLTAPAWAGIALAAAGLLSLRPAGWRGHAEVRALAYAFLTAAGIATYTLIDSAGARGAASGASYGFAGAMATSATLTLVNLARPARRARAGLLRAEWRRHLAGGAATATAYTMVLVAVRHAPVGYVAMLRESSVVLGALLGWLLLGEGLGPRRLASSAVVLAGLAILVVAQT